jgi:S-adenosylmethionine decarboxylase
VYETVQEGNGLKATGQHLLVEYLGCDQTILDDRPRIESLMKKAARAANATIVNAVFHTYSPQGVSGVVVIEESHLSIHTWPEHGYAAVDFFTCGKCFPDIAYEVLRQGLKAEAAEKMLVVRGLLPKTPSMQIVQHESDTRGQTPENDPTLTKTDPAPVPDGEQRDPCAQRR